MAKLTKKNEEERWRTVLEMISKLRENHRKADELMIKLEKVVHLHLLWPEAFEGDKKPSYGLSEAGNRWGKNPWELCLRLGDEKRVIPFNDIPDVFLSEQQLGLREARQRRVLQRESRLGNASTAP